MYDLPDNTGHFGQYVGVFVAETLIDALDQLKAAYIDAELEIVETALWHVKIARKDFSVALNLTGSAVDDPDQQFFENFACKSERNYTNYCNADIEKMFAEQSREKDVEKRKKLVWEIDRRLLEDGARPPIMWNSSATCWHPYVKGFKPQVNSRRSLLLVRAGIGTIGVVDDDKVALSNLQRQVIHDTARIGMAKTESAAQAMSRLNPHVRIVQHHERLTADNAMAIIGGYDIVADGCDNFPTRFLIADACYFARKTVVAAALLRFEGQLSVFKPWTGGPCYRCLFREAPPPDLVPRCEEAGILGTVAGVLGTLQATETIKEVLGLGDSLSGRLVIYDALSAEFRKIAFPRDPACALCGPQATLRDLSIHVKPAPAPAG